MFSPLVLILANKFRAIKSLLAKKCVKIHTKCKSPNMRNENNSCKTFIEFANIYATYIFATLCSNQLATPRIWAKKAQLFGDFFVSFGRQTRAQRDGKH